MITSQMFVRPNIAALIERGDITVEEMRNLCVNSYEWEAMIPSLSIDALIESTEHAIANCPRGSVPARSYPEAVHNVYAPELIKRLRQMSCVCQKVVSP